MTEAHRDDLPREAPIAPPPVPCISLAEQIECVERELRFRHRVYAYRVSQEKMTKAQADIEIARMTAVLHTLNKLRTNEPFALT